MIAGVLKDKALAGELARIAKNYGKVGRLVLQYMLHASWGKATIRDPDARLKFFTENVTKYCRPTLAAMHFDLKVVGYDAEMMANRNFLIVCNHLSYVDVMAMATVQPTVFITSVDMGETFFLGTMAELGGSIFVERRHRSQIGRDTGVIADTLRKGHQVMIYPEGTSSDGQHILPFKKSLLMAAVEAGVDILPVVIKYMEIDGEPFGPANADKVAWFGDMPFVPHMNGLLSNKSVKAELRFLEPIKVSKESSRHELSDQAYKAMTESYAR